MRTTCKHSSIGDIRDSSICGCTRGSRIESAQRGTGAWLELAQSQHGTQSRCEKGMVARGACSCLALHLAELS